MKLAVQPGLQHSAIEYEGGGVQDFRLHDDCIRRAANSVAAQHETHLKSQLHKILPAPDVQAIPPLDGRNVLSKVVRSLQCPATNFSEKTRFPEAELGKADVHL